jgi:hypothetical protein
MTDSLSEFLSIGGVCLLQMLFMGGIVALVVGIAYFSRQARLRAWGELASRLGLTLEPGSFFVSPRVTGTYRGRPLTLHTFTRGSGRHRHTYTRVHIGLENPAGIRFAVYQEGVFSAIGKLFGMQDVQIGDEELDRRFVIKSQPESFAASLVTSISLRGKLLQARSVNIEVEGGEVTHTQHGVLMDVEYLRFVFELLCEVADFVGRASGFPGGRADAGPGWLGTTNQPSTTSW